MMENKLVQRFINEVNEVISSEQERDALFEALRNYQEGSDISSLVRDLQRVLNEPAKLEIYEYIRPLVRAKHQQQYDKMAPSAPGQKLRVIRLRRRQNESLGFAVRGGFEHNIGVFVSRVDPGSQAEQHGLRVGDEIVRVNGFTIVEAIHEEVLNLIKGKDEIELKVTNIGMLPVKQNPNDPVTWQYVDKAGNIRPQVQAPGSQNTVPPDEVKIFINTRGATSLGCTIMSGPKTFPGVFIETVKPGGLAEEYRLGVGDQIMEVNGKSFIDIKHEEAIVELKGSKELNMVIRKGAALPLMNAQRKKQRSPGGSPQPPRNNAGRNQPQPGPSYTEPDRSPEILENIEEEERRLWEEEQERMRRKREEERVKAQFRQKEIERQAELERKKQEEERRRNEEEKQRRLAEERRREEEREREEQRRKEEELEIKREEEMEKKREKERQKRLVEEEKKKKLEIRQQKQEDGTSKNWKQRQKEKDFYRRVKFNQKEAERAKQLYLSDRQQELEALKSFRSAVLAGRAGPVSAMKPALLGAADTPPKAPAASRTKKKIAEVVIKKEEDVPLDIEVEGGTDSPLGGKIVVADVYSNGLADRNGGIKKGDQILKVNGKSLENITLSQAQELLWNAEQASGATIKFHIVESSFPTISSEITYF